MDTALTPVESLAPAFERLRAAHLAHIPSYGERLSALERLENAVRACRDDLVAACNADFGRRATLETLGADVMVSLDEIRHAKKHLRQWMRPQSRAVNFVTRRWAWWASSRLGTIPSSWRSRRWPARSPPATA